MNNALILLTNYYPFHKGEEYLESEIEHLSKNFQDIYIISTMVSTNMEQTRTVPSNVKVLPVGISHSKVGKVKMFSNQFKSIYKNSSKRKLIKEDSKGNMLPKLYCYYFESRAMDIYDRVAKLLDNYNFDRYESVTIYSYWLYVTARVSVELKNNYFNNKQPYTISRAHRYDLYEDAAPLKYLPQRDYLLKSLDAIYPCSQDGVEALNTTYPAYKDKVAVRRLGTITRNVRSKTSSDKLYIVSCSVMRKVKRLDLLIESLVELEKKNIPYLWTHIGGGPEFEAVKKLAEKKLNMEQVNFTGFMKNEDVLRWYTENPATVFVNLSSSEGVPVAIMEATSMGLPVIATDVGGTREIVENEVNGYLLSKDCSVNNVVESMESFYNLNETEYSKMSDNALEIWRERSDATVLYADFANQLLQQVPQSS
ncbi:glycosyltransferase [Priestia megaterium]|uniref:glycosyltransferase n=1 Tax=Priestia megaterium TaxID=1404 RepID=UPI000BF9ABAE|nr:glycosyltransferase [Priestia megaterium]MDH2453846.1 glycosyltransferase [Priestia megaterium]MDL5153303.1 glycosyltransferase [Priestia megaterium]PEW15571.1 glycosyl transferase family 1 [Priestia megaterium]PFJ45108.1 glycosyl transferase family 1 [Priestia megaterium]PGX78857.1 glycosyl transferase family 1 [Priestia megaterium]